MPGSEDVPGEHAAVELLYRLGMSRQVSPGRLREARQAGREGRYLPWRGGHITTVAMPLRADQTMYVISWNF